MNFQRLPSPVNNLDVWGTSKGAFTFVISIDNEHVDEGYRASVKKHGARPFDNTRIDIGDRHQSFLAAENACKAWYKANHQ